MKLSRRWERSPQKQGSTNSYSNSSNFVHPKSMAAPFACSITFCRARASASPLTNSIWWLSGARRRCFRRANARRWLGPRRLLLSPRASATTSMRRCARNFRIVNWPISLPPSVRSTSGTDWERLIAGRRLLLPRRPHSPFQKWQGAADHRDVRTLAQKRAVGLVFCALDVRAVLGHHHNSCPGPDVWGDRGAHAIGQDGRLVGGRGGLALGDGLGVHDFQGRALGHLDGDWNDAVQRKLHGHIFLQVRRGRTDHIFRNPHLVVVLRVHEVKAIGIFVQIVEVVILDGRFLNLIGGLVAFGNLHAVADAAHFDLADRCALAGMDILGGQHDVKFAVLFNDVALANRTGDYFQSCFPGILARDRSGHGRPKASEAVRAATYSFCRLMPAFYDAQEQPWNNRA